MNAVLYVYVMTMSCWVSLGCKSGVDPDNVQRRGGNNFTKVPSEKQSRTLTYLAPSTVPKTFFEVSSVKNQAPKCWLRKTWPFLGLLYFVLVIISKPTVLCFTLGIFRKLAYATLSLDMLRNSRQCYKASLTSFSSFCRGLIKRGQK